MALTPDLTEAGTAATVVQKPAGDAGGPPRDFVLSVISGPDKGRAFPITATSPRQHIGQGATCEIRLTDSTVSRRHAAVELRGSVLRLQDLESTNGTFIDRVKAYLADLVGGELLRLGATVLRVDEVASDPSRVLPAATGFGRMLGKSASMRKLYPLCEALASSDVPAILEGETGTGKEALAEALHEEGKRKAGPFVVFDCTAVSASLAESELFGHERGAFTGAVSGRRGVFEQADGGTLLIDEIGDLDLSLQPKLLRAIERSEIRRMGGERWVRVDVRILCATRRDLDKQVELARFRDDLFHRIAVGRIELPPLRDRAGDVPLLARAFWEKLGGAPEALSDQLLARWEAEKWPGNVRELRNAVSRQLVLGHLPNLEHQKPSSTRDDGIEPLLSLPFPQARDRMLELFTERYVQHVLAEHDGDIVRAATSSGIGRRYFEKLRARGK